MSADAKAGAAPAPSRSGWAYTKRRRAEDPEYRKRYNADMASYKRKRRAEDPEYRRLENVRSAAWKKKRRAEDPEYRERDNARAADWIKRRLEEDPGYMKQLSAYTATWTKKRLEKDPEYRKQMNDISAASKKKGRLRLAHKQLLPGLGPFIMAQQLAETAEAYGRQPPGPELGLLSLDTIYPEWGPPYPGKEDF